MAFIERDDYLTKIKDANLTKLVSDSGSADILLNAEDTAIQTIKDALHSRYDVDAIFAKTGAARDKQVIRWVCNLVLYYLYERLPDKLIPDNIIKNYDATVEYLQALEDGKRSSQLDRLNDSDNNKLTKFRWGSEKKRTH